MANYATLKAAIQTVIKQNGNNEITGDLLQQALLSMIDSLGAGYQFGGVAKPDDNPGTPDYKIAYIAGTPGTYSNFGGIVIEKGEVATLEWSGGWTKKNTGAATRDEMRPYASMGASVLGEYFLDKNAVFSSTELIYKQSNVYDTAWVNIVDGATKITVSGATQYVFRFFSSFDTLDSTTNLGTNSTGNIVAGAKLALIAFAHSANPDGYGSLSIKQDGIIGMIKDYFPRGMYLAKNHVLNVVGTSIKFQENANFDCLIIYTQGATKLTLSNVLSTARYRFFDSSEIFDGSEISTHHLGYNTTGAVIPGAVVCILSLRHSDYPDGLDAVTLSREYGEVQKKKIRLLLIGNSATDDAMSYVPFILQNMGIPVDFQIGIAMLSSSTLAMHVNNWENETAAYSFRLYNGGAAWQNFADKSLQWMFDNYTWDIVSLQQAQPQNGNTYQPYCNQLINYISAYVDNAIKFIWYQTHIYAAQSNSGAPRSEETILQYYESQMAACENIIGNTVCEFVVPVSTAIQNARSVPAIKAIGDYANNENNNTGYGYLNYLDGVHLQEGLPCQIAAYVFVLALMEIYGFKEYSINGETTRVTSAWTSGKNIPSPHGSPVGSTDANCLIAQKCAIMAMKRPFEITDMNGIVNPE